METIGKAYQILLIFSTVYLALSVCVCLVRAIMGPFFTDRIVAINVASTKVVIIISIISCIFKESSFLDIALVYAAINFLAVVVLSKSYILPHHINLTDPALSPDDIRLLHNNREEAIK